MDLAPGALGVAEAEDVTLRERVHPPGPWKGLPGPFGKAEEGSCLASPGPKWEHKYVPGQPDPDGLDYGVY